MEETRNSDLFFCPDTAQLILSNMDPAKIIEKFIAFRRDVVVRRTKFDLARAKERAHILEGLIIALKNIDAIVTLIKASKNPQDAAVKLCEKFKLSEIQAKAILEMRLQRLTGLERAKIDEEYAEVKALMAKLEAILADEQKVLQVIIDELNEIKERYGDERRTEIVASTDDIDIEDMIVEEDMVVTITHTGYIKRNPISLYRSQHRGGKGKVGIQVKEEDFLENLFIASTHDYILFFTDRERRNVTINVMGDPAGWITVMPGSFSSNLVTVNVTVDNEVLGEPSGMKTLTVKVACRSFGKKDVGMSTISAEQAIRMSVKVPRLIALWLMHHSENRR